MSFCFSPHIYLFNLTKISTCYSKKDRANLGPSLKHKRASSESYLALSKAYVFIYYIGLKTKQLWHLPAIVCFLLAQLFLPVALFKLWNPHVCLLFSSAGTATEGLIRTGIRSQAKGIQGSTECFLSQLLVTAILRQITVIKRLAKYQHVIRLCMD